MLLNLLWLCVPAYAVVQFAVIWRTAGKGRLLAAIPLVLMLGVVVYSLVGLWIGSNLWPLVLLFTSPLALLFALLALVLIPAHNPSAVTFAEIHR